MTSGNERPEAIFTLNTRAREGGGRSADDNREIGVIWMSYPAVLATLEQLERLPTEWSKTSIQEAKAGVYSKRVLRAPQSPLSREPVDGLISALQDGQPGWLPPEVNDHLTPDTTSPVPMELMGVNYVFQVEQSNGRNYDLEDMDRALLLEGALYQAPANRIPEHWHEYRVEVGTEQALDVLRRGVGANGSRRDLLSALNPTDWAELIEQCPSSHRADLLGVLGKREQSSSVRSHTEAGRTTS